MNDVLSDIFETIRLRATLYFRTDYSPPWAIAVPPYAQAARFHLVIQGRCHVALASGWTGDLGPGDLILITRGQGHTLADGPDRSPAPLEQVMEESGYDGADVFVVGKGDPATSTQMICGHFSFTAGADHPLLRALPEVIVMTSADRARHALLDDTLRLLTRWTFASGLGAAAAVSRLSEVFFIETVRASIQQCSQLARVIGAMSDPQIGRALELMHKDAARPWTVESLALAAGMSRSRFAERFSTLMGEGPLSYLTDWRLQQALILLGQPRVTIQEAAARVGYQSAAAFTRAFTQRFGASPSERRER